MTGSMDDTFARFIGRARINGTNEESAEQKEILVPLKEMTVEVCNGTSATTRSQHLTANPLVLDDLVKVIR